MHAPTPLHDAPLPNSLGLAKAPWNTRVVVAMSGGVDSSVVAAMLASEGYDVVGVTLQLYDHGAAVHRKGACCAGQDIHDARDVAARLGIPHYVLDYEARFREKVIEPFRRSLCRRRDADPLRRLQPAHQVRRPVRDGARSRRRRAGDRPLCRRRGRRAEGRARSTAPPTPTATRAISCSRRRASSSTCCAFRSAACPRPRCASSRGSFGLAVADKADSQDICFVPSGRYSRHDRARCCRAPPSPGDIVHVDGRVLGRHAGILHYTIGQRRGLGVAAAEPLYVVALDAAARAGRSSARARRWRRRAFACATSIGSATAGLKHAGGRARHRRARALDASARRPPA